MNGEEEYKMAAFGYIDQKFGEYPQSVWLINLSENGIAVAPPRRFLDAYHARALARELMECADKLEAMREPV